MVDMCRRMLGFLFQRALLFCMWLFGGVVAVGARLQQSFACIGAIARWLACSGLSVACRRPSHFSLLAQREVTKRNGLFESADPTSLGA
jgi:hypothetical protein